MHWPLVVGGGCASTTVMSPLVNGLLRGRRRRLASNRSALGPRGGAKVSGWSSTTWTVTMRPAKVHLVLEVDGRGVPLNREARDRPTEVKGATDGVEPHQSARILAAGAACRVEFKDRGTNTEEVDDDSRCTGQDTESCCGGGAGGAALETLGKAKAAPTIAVVRISFSFMVAPLGRDGDARSTTPNSALQARPTAPTSPTQYPPLRAGAVFGTGRTRLPGTSRTRAVDRDCSTEEATSYCETA